MSNRRTIFTILAAVCAAILVGTAIAVGAFVYIINSIQSDLASLFSSPSAQEALEDGGWPQPFKDIDFSAGPVDLVVETSAGEFGIRDPERQKQAAMMGFPDFAGAELGRLFMSFAFLSPVPMAGGKTGLTFSRDGRILAQAACRTSICGDDPILAAYMDELTRNALPLVAHTQSFTDYDAYLAMRQKVMALPDRFGPLSPETVEEFEPLPDRIYLNFPVIYADGLTEEIAKAHAETLVDAFRRRFAAQQQEFRLLSPPTVTVERDYLYLQDCRTGEPILINDNLAPIPPGYAFASISLHIATSPELAERLSSANAWHFLPRGPADKAALTQAIRRDLVAQGIADDPGRCFAVPNSFSGETIGIIHDSFTGYDLGWRTIQADVTY